jgi:hypothetical protein
MVEQVQLVLPARTGKAIARCAVPVAALVGLVLVGSDVQAGLVTANYKGAAPGLAIAYTLEDTPGMPQPLTKRLTMAGVYNWAKVSGGDALPVHFATFCIELNQHISTAAVVNPYTYALVDLEDGSQPGIGTGGPGNDGPIGTVKANQIRQLWGMHHADVTDPVSAAAFQIAVWEIVYGPWFTPYPHPSTPQLAADGAAAIALAASWVADVQTPNPSLYENRLLAMTSPQAQDQLVLYTPAPGGLTLAGIGLLGLLGCARRRRAAG